MIIENIVLFMCVMIGGCFRMDGVRFMEPVKLRLRKSNNII